MDWYGKIGYCDGQDKKFVFVKEIRYTNDSNDRWCDGFLKSGGNRHGCIF